MLTGFNKIAVNICLGDSANGIYAIGSRFGTLVSFVTICFTYAWQDLSFSKANDVDDRSEFYSKAYNIYSKFLLTGMLLLLPVCYWMFIIMINGDYVEAIITVPTFLCVAVLSALTSFVENVFYAIKDTKTLLVSTLIAAIVNVALVFPLVNLFGINGANYAAIIAFAVNLIIRCIVLKKKIKFKSRWLTQVVLMVIWIFEHILFEDMGHIESLILLLVNIAISVVLFRKDVLHFLNINTSIDKNAG